MGIDAVVRFQAMAMESEKTFMVYVNDAGASFGLEVSLPQWRGIGDLEADRAATVMYDEMWRVIQPIDANSPSLGKCEKVILWSGVRRIANEVLPKDRVNIAWCGDHFEVEGDADVDAAARSFLDALCAKANADERARDWASAWAKHETNAGARP